MSKSIHFPSLTLRFFVIIACFFWLGNAAASWHPDPDNDGVDASIDRCPNIYDPQQGDADGDGTGDYCDADFAPPARDGKVTDLRIEHVTPYGVWLTLTSPYDAEWGWESAVAWSTDPNELKTTSGFASAHARGDLLGLNRIHANFGERIHEPIILTQLSPNTVYHVALTRGSSGDGFDSRISNIVSFKTAPIAMPQPAQTHPRVYVTPGFIQELKQRKANNDSGWVKWENKVRTNAQDATSGSDGDERQYCSDAALLYQVTGSAQDRTTALTLLDTSITHWENTALANNQYRWENAQLGACLDLLWNEVNEPKRNRAIRAFLEDDEARIAGYLSIRDTDEYAAFPRNWIIDGLVACGANGIDPALSARACEVLDAGHRLWHGVQLVKARRGKGKYAQSGGFKPDGTSYAHGTQVYWLESFLALANAGEPLSKYGQHIENALLSIFVHLLTPTQKGFAPVGDIENYTDNFNLEPNSYQLRRANGGVLGLFSGVLKKAGRAQAAGWAQYLAKSKFDVNPLNKVDNTTKYRLMFETDSLASVNYKDSLDTFFHAEGFGLILDRSSWDQNASYLMFRAGWNGVDHVHADSGHFQLYRRGQWLTHESIAYDGLASCLGHNTWVMKTGDDANGACPNSLGQNYYAVSDNGKSHILRSGSGQSYTYVAAEIAGAYNSFKENARNFKSVQRSLLWLKDAEENGVDTLVILDRIETTQNAAPDVIKYFQVHMDNEPSINGQRAEAIMGSQQLVVDVVSPAAATLSTIAPTGQPGSHNDQAIYTHRLRIAPGAGNGLVNMVTVLRGSNAGVALDQPVPVTAGNLQGTFVQGTLVLMPIAPIDENASGLASASVKFPTTGSVKLFITGLAPNTGYTVSATQAGSELTISLAPNGNTETGAGGVLGVYIDGNRKISPMETTSAIFKNSFEAGA